MSQGTPDNCVCSILLFEQQETYTKGSSQLRTKDSSQHAIQHLFNTQHGFLAALSTWPLRQLQRS